MLNIFFNYLRKFLVLTLTIIFAFVVVYVPQEFSQQKTVPLVEASCFFSPICPTAEVPFSPLSIAAGAIAINTGTVTFKELTLDAVFNALAKAIVSALVASTVDWINSGFKGSPAFVTDLGGFLLETLDKKAFQIIEELGGDASFLCTPFKLDIQLALAISYDQARINRPYEGCSVSNFVGDLEQFINGDFEQGGWRDWIKLTTNPEKYTPVGQYYSAKASFEKQLADEKERERDTLAHGSGFKSGKICEGVERASSATGAISNTNVTAAGVQNANTTNFSGEISNFNISADSVQNANTTNFNGGFSSLSTPSSVPSSPGTTSGTPVTAQADPIQALTTQPINTSTTGAAPRTTTLRIPTGISIGATLRCAISKPGRMIADRLAKSLGLSDDSLITADEINEIIQALFAQLATRALTGAAGLLGLSAGTGYTAADYQGGSYIAALREQQAAATRDKLEDESINPAVQVAVMQDALQVQEAVASLANQQVPILRNYLTLPRITTEQRQRAQSALNEAISAQAQAPDKAAAIVPLINRAQALQLEYDRVDTTVDRKTAILQEILGIDTNFRRFDPYPPAYLSAVRTDWDPSRY